MRGYTEEGTFPVTIQMSNVLRGSTGLVVAIAGMFGGRLVAEAPPIYGNLALVLPMTLLVVIAIVVAHSDATRQRWFLKVVTIGTILVVVLGIGYFIAESTLVYQLEGESGPRIRGLWLTEEAKAMRPGPLTPQDLVERFPHPDYVWSPNSVRCSSILLLVLYLLLFIVIGGTLLLTTRWAVSKATGS